MNKIYEFEISRIVPGGSGMGFADGQTIFVPLTAPGDVVRAEVYRKRGKVGFATLVEVVSRSADRVEPPCEYYGLCGGCDFQHLTYAAQLQAKQAIVVDCLRRVARLSNIEAVPIVAAPKELHYRSRAEWQYDGISQRLGYFERASHDVCDVKECLVLDARLEKRLLVMRDRIAAAGAPEGDVIHTAAGDDAVSEFSELDQKPAEVVRRTIAGVSYRFDATVFFQTNTALLDRFVHDTVSDLAGELALDLFCGVGLFSIPLAQRFTQVIGIDGHRASVNYAVQNAADANCANLRFACADIAGWLRSASAKDLAPDLILLDPPRAGVGIEVVKQLCKLNAQTIVYVSCDPATLARDIAEFVAGGYQLASVTAYDMFPQTHHVEVVAHLQRAGAATI